VPAQLSNVPGQHGFLQTPQVQLELLTQAADACVLPVLLQVLAVLQAHCCYLLHACCCCCLSFLQGQRLTVMQIWALRCGWMLFLVCWTPTFPPAVAQTCWHSMQQMLGVLHV
jgi:hypothetical protein